MVETSVTYVLDKTRHSVYKTDIVAENSYLDIEKKAVVVDRPT